MSQDPDFRLTADDYSRYRAAYPGLVYPRLAELKVGLPGQAVIDLAAGTGLLARPMAQGGATVTSVDRSEDMLDAARELDRRLGIEGRYLRAPAERVPLPDGEADAVVIGQAWHWLDRPLAAREALRLLRSGGAIAIVHFDWLPVDANVAARTEDLILRTNPRWEREHSLGVRPAWSGELIAAGFVSPTRFADEIDVPFSHEAWRGRVRASAGIGAALDPAAVAAFDDELGRMLAEEFTDQPMPVPHRVTALVATAP